MANDPALDPSTPHSPPLGAHLDDHFSLNLIPLDSLSHTPTLPFDHHLCHDSLHALDKILNSHFLGFPSLPTPPSASHPSPPPQPHFNPAIVHPAPALLNPELFPQPTAALDIPLDPLLLADAPLATELACPSAPPPPSPAPPPRKSKRTRDRAAPLCSLTDAGLLSTQSQPGGAKNRRPRRRPSSSLSAILVTPAAAPVDPNVHPALQAGALVDKPRSPRRRRGPDPSESRATGLSSSTVDVHGAGAGGGAAAVLAGAATPLPLDTVREQSVEPAPLDAIPTSYDPDQFRASQRIQWTQSEENLLIEEVGLYYQRYDCMAHIISRHGKNGTVSKKFADRSGVSLKDKAVNISSRWFRDGGAPRTVSEELKKAFLRFRPKQMRGRSRSEVVALVLGSSNSHATGLV